MERAVFEKISYPEPSFPFVIKTGYIKPYKSSSLSNHPEIEIQYIHKGSGFYFVKNRKYSLSKNTLIIIYPYEVHNFISSTSLHKTSINISSRNILKNKNVFRKYRKNFKV